MAKPKPIESWAHKVEEQIDRLIAQVDDLTIKVGLLEDVAAPPSDPK